MSDFFASTARQQREHRTPGIETITFAKFRSGSCGADYICQRMTDVTNVETLAFVELLFERKYDDHSIDVAPHRVNSIPAPRPNLRADVVNDFETVSM